MRQAAADKLWLDIAHRVAAESYCRRRQVGAVIVRGHHPLSIGYNGTPTGMPNVCEGPDGETLPFVLHAEANAILKLVQSTEHTRDATLYTTHAPCMECAKLILQAGITRVVYTHTTSAKLCGVQLLAAAGVQVTART